MWRTSWQRILFENETFLVLCGVGDETTGTGTTTSSLSLSTCTVGGEQLSKTVFFGGVPDGPSNPQSNGDRGDVLPYGNDGTSGFVLGRGVANKLSVARSVVILLIVVFGRYASGWRGFQIAHRQFGWDRFRRFLTFW